MFSRLCCFRLLASSILIVNHLMKMTSSLTSMDESCGITQYLTPKENGFKCILKLRCEDFIVHEIDLEGDVVRLRDLGSDISKKATTEENAGNSAKADPKVYPMPDDPSCFTVEFCEHLMKLDRKEISEEITVDIKDMNKNQRKVIHCLIRERYNNLDSITVSNENLIKISPKTNRTRKRSFWPEDRGDYCKFTLYKENKDTSFAVSVISRYLRMSLSTAGTKDKRAVTCQKATVYRIERDKLAALNEKLIQMKIGDFEYCDKQLKLGDLTGNRFTVVLRNIEGIEDDQIKSYVENFMNIGFINYYGLQRFGTLNVPTYEIGKSVLRKNWLEAVDLILTPRKCAFGLSEALSTWSTTKDAIEACKFLPKSQNQIEGNLLLSLKKYQPVKNYAAAFNSIPRNIRNLYLHSVQSLLWNKLASKRVEKYGTQVLEGDFYVQNDRDMEYQVVDSDNKERVDHFQIVLPFFASRDHLPKNEMSQWYDELLEEEGITWERLQQGAKEYALHGGFRKLFIKINGDNNFNYEILHYDDFDQILTLTDLDILNGKTLDLKQSGSCKFKGLKIEFNLPSSSYATMALRELTKCDFSKQNQTNLTKKLVADENLKNENQILTNDDDTCDVDCE